MKNEHNLEWCPFITVSLHMPDCLISDLFLASSVTFLSIILARSEILTLGKICLNSQYGSKLTAAPVSSLTLAVQWLPDLFAMCRSVKIHLYLACNLVVISSKNMFCYTLLNMLVMKYTLEITEFESYM